MFFAFTVTTYTMYLSVILVQLEPSTFFCVNLFHNLYSIYSNLTVMKLQIDFTVPIKTFNSSRNYTIYCIAAAGKHAHSMMLPLQCFMVEMVCLWGCEVFWLRFSFDFLMMEYLNWKCFFIQSPDLYSTLTFMWICVLLSS